MELKLKQIAFPEVIEFNYDDLKKEVTQRASAYVGLIYAEDQIKDAKKDVAMLRKFTKALSDERIRVKKDLMKPYEEFEKKIKELTGIVDKAISDIDSQVKGYEDQKKQEKLEQIKAYWSEKEKPFEIDFEKVMDQKWLNASVSLKSVYGAIDVLLEGIEKDIATLRILPEFGFEALEVYKTTLDINKALNEGKRLSEMQKRKAEYEAAQAAKKEEEQLAGQIGFTDAESFERCMNQQPETDIGKCIADIERQAFEQAAGQERQWVSFQAHLTVEDAQHLVNFFASRGIEYKPL